MSDDLKCGACADGRWCADHGADGLYWTIGCQRATIEELSRDRDYLQAACDAHWSYIQILEARLAEAKANTLEAQGWKLEGSGWSGDGTERRHYRRGPL